jgi:hypothetical protein
MGQSGLMGQGVYNPTPNLMYQNPMNPFLMNQMQAPQPPNLNLQNNLGTNPPVMNPFFNNIYSNP